jgi:hypothetical protein
MGLSRGMVGFLTAFPVRLRFPLQGNNLHNECLTALTALTGGKHRAHGYLPGIEIIELATHCHNEQARNAAAFQYGKHIDGIADTAALPLMAVASYSKEIKLEESQ